MFFQPTLLGFHDGFLYGVLYSEGEPSLEASQDGNNWSKTALKVEEVGSGTLKLYAFSIFLKPVGPLTCYLNTGKNSDTGSQELKSVNSVDPSGALKLPCAPSFSTPFIFMETPFAARGCLLICGVIAARDEPAGKGFLDGSSRLSFATSAKREGLIRLVKVQVEPQKEISYRFKV